MGIKNLKRFLQKHAPKNLETRISLQDFSNTRIAVDTNFYLNTFKIYNEKTWMAEFISMIISLRECDIEPVFVFDTKIPDIKLAVIQDRRDKRDAVKNRILEIESAIKEYETTGQIASVLSDMMVKYAPILQTLRPSTTLDMQIINSELAKLYKQSVHIDSGDIELVKELLDILGLAYLDSVDEGEILCAALCKAKITSAVLTNDSDVLAHATPISLSNLVFGRKISVPYANQIAYTDVLEVMDMTTESFTDFCIMCGTDYNKNIFRIGVEKAYKLIHEWKSIENIRDNTKLDVDILNHVNVRAKFAESNIIPDVCLDRKQIDESRLNIFLCRVRCMQFENKLKYI